LTRTESSLTLLRDLKLRCLYGESFVRKLTKITAFNFSFV